MKRAGPKRVALIVLLVLIILGVFVAYYRYLQKNFMEHSATKYRQSPTYLGSINCGKTFGLFGSEKSGKRPLSVSTSKGKIYLTYTDSDKVDILSYSGEVLNSFSVSRPNMPAAKPVSAGTDQKEKIYVTDSRNHELKIFDSRGQFIDSYGWMPNYKKPLDPTRFYLDRGLLYLADVGIPSILVISVVEKKPFRESGELILAIPLSSKKTGPPPGSGILPNAPVNIDPASRLKRPLGVAVTKDGRVLVSDSGLGLVKAYTCVGKYAYDFKQGGKEDSLSDPQGIALDDRSNPKLKNQKEIRVHVADKKRKKIFVFTDKGKFLFSYGDSGKGKLSSPTDIAVDQQKDLILIADGGNERVEVYGY